MKLRLLIALMLVLTAWLIFGKSSCDNPPKTVAHVDLERYMGWWYEIAKFPNTFEKGCVGTKALYTMLPDGKIEVINECFDKECGSKLRTTKGTAWVVDPNSLARLKVRFFWPFTGDYWIIDLDQEKYSYAVISDPCRKHLWILSRKPKMTPAVYYLIQDHLKKQGYDVEKLQLTPQCSY